MYVYIQQDHSMNGPVLYFTKKAEGSIMSKETVILSELSYEQGMEPQTGHQGGS